MLFALALVSLVTSAFQGPQDHLTWAEEAVQKSKEILQKEGHVEKLGVNKQEGQEVQPSQPSTQTLEGFFQKKGGLYGANPEDEDLVSPELTSAPDKESEGNSCTRHKKDWGKYPSVTTISPDEEKGKRGSSGDIQSLDLTAACGKGKPGKCPIGDYKPQNTEPQEDQVLVFVSFSMPEASLKSLLVEAEGKNVVLVVRGLIEDSFSKTAQKLKDLKGWMEINPELFEEYDIKAVPTFVQLKNREVKARLQGNVSLAYALEVLKKEESA